MSAVLKDMPTESAAQRAKRRLASMKEARNSYDDHWKQLSEFFSPRRSRWLDKDQVSTRGSKMNQKAVDPTPIICARTLGAGMHAGLSNPATKWFKLTTPDTEMMEFPAVAMWLEAVENEIRAIFERGNLYSALPLVYRDTGVYGTTPIFMPEHRLRVVSFIPKPIGSYYLASNSDGVVDTMYCEYQMTARNMYADFGERCSDSVKANVRNQQREVSSAVLHAIEPNEGRKYGNFSSANMRWASNYFETAAGDEQQALRLSGYEDNPIATFQWEKTEITDPYGSSCGMDALGISKALQVQTKQKAKAVDKLVDPPMVGDPALKNQPSSLIAGDITYAGFTPNGAAPKFQPAYTIRPEVDKLIEDIRDIRDQCRETMFYNLFFAITLADPRNATIPEIDARRAEQVIGLGPVIQNATDMMKQVIDRVFYVGMRQGRFPPPPPELAGVDLKVEMTGMLAQTFKMLTANKLDRFMGYVGSVAKAQADAGQEVTAFDKVDMLQTIDEMHLALGTPASIVRSDEDVAKIQQDRAAAQAQQQQMAAAGPIKDLAQAAKAASETKLGTGSALDAVAA